MHLKIVNILNKNHEAYIVGGAVRDMLLGQEPSDYDIATSATPLEVKEALKDFKIIDTGIDHGTVTVYDKDSNSSYEITTFRKDVSTDGRNATVEFTKELVEDLARRDFTINAIAYCPKTNRFIDPFGGIKDIDLKMIRTVGKAEDRFREDYLRMFRLARFSAQLGFLIEEKTMRGLEVVAKDNFQSKISPERIKAEIDKGFIKAELPSVMIHILDYCGLLDHIIPELKLAEDTEQNNYHSYNVYDHIMVALDSIPPGEKNRLLRYSVLFHDLGKVQAYEKGEDGIIHFKGHEDYSTNIADRIMRFLKFSNYERDYVLNVVSNHMRHITLDTKPNKVRRFVKEIGEEFIPIYVSHKAADKIGKGKPEEYDEEYYDKLQEYMFKCIEDMPIKKSSLAINGNDVMKILGIGPGPEVGRRLRKIEEEILDGALRNIRDHLIYYLKFCR